MLIVFGGLPGTGKTTIAREIARRRRAVYLRIDSIEQAIRSAGLSIEEIGAMGYDVAYVLAEANLKLGQVVVADSVNPIELSRGAWRAVATAASVSIAEIEVVCSDAREHRRRVESRSHDVRGLIPPTWDDVVRRHYEPWSSPRIVVDTATLSVREAVKSLDLEIDAFFVRARATPRTEARRDQPG